MKDAIQISEVQRAEAIHILEKTWDAIHDDALSAYGSMTREQIQNYTADFVETGYHCSVIKIQSWKNASQWSKFWWGMGYNERQALLNAAIHEDWSV